MPNPRQMFDHTLDALKGWPSPYAVDFVAKLSADVTIDPVFAGRVVHVNSDHEFEMGFACCQMPIFLLQNSDDPDVKNSGGDHWTAVQPAGNMSGLVAIGAYELASTEFDADQEYFANEPLTAEASNTVAATGGVLTNQGAVPYTDPVCGIVSRGVSRNSYGKDVLNFWPVFLPAPCVSSG